MLNLRDQLLKAGLVTEEQAKKAAEQPPKPKRAPPPPRRDFSPRHESSSRHDSPPQAQGPMITVRHQPLSSVPKLPPMQGSKAHQRLQALEQQELDKKLRELVTAGQIALETGDTVFHFVTRKGKLRRLELSKVQAERLEKGELAVVERPEPAQIEHSLVPPEVAEMAHALSATAVRFFNRPGSPLGFAPDAPVGAAEVETEAEREATSTEAAEAPGSAPEASDPSGNAEG
jgi:hypothetical protein